MAIHDVLNIIGTPRDQEPSGLPEKQEKPVVGDLQVILDALASLGSMRLSHCIDLRFWHIFRVCLGYVQSMFRVCSGYVQGMFRVCSE